MIEPRVFAKIRFVSLDEKMIILPGDLVKIRHVSSYTDHNSIRMMPDIESSKLPRPLKDRYQHTAAAGSFTYLPCDDMKVADSITCKDFEINCADGNDRVVFSIQGAGD